MWLLLLIGLVSALEVHAQEWGAWQVIGPFDHPGGADEIATPAGPEDPPGAPDGEPRLARTYPGKGGARLSWKSLGGAGLLDVGPIDLRASLDAPPGVEAWSDRAVAYLYRAIDCARPVELAVRTGSDDGMRLWLNGELLIDRAVPRALNTADHALLLRLHEGRNHLWVKVANGGGAWKYQLSGWSRIGQGAIDQAIDRGVQMLLRNQLLDGSWPGQELWGDGQSAYAAYCLVKSGLAPTHPALRRAQSFVLEAPPAPTTYATSCELLFLCALKDPELEPEIERRVDNLLDWQDHNGLWAYPTHPGGAVLPTDLSNTLYAALALHAASESGVRVPERAWTRLLGGTLSCFEGLDKRRAPSSGGGLGPPAGFSYRVGGKPSGSMTTAGVSVIEICRQGLGGDLPAKYRAEAARARRAGLAWLATRTGWDGNPGAGTAHHYFYIYGMERVGSLLGLERIGDLEWYPDGAEWLVRAQDGSGSWGGAENTIDTILALLFLRRASAPSTGGQVAPKGDRWSTEDPSAQVRIAVAGAPEATLWVVGFGDGVAGAGSKTGERRPLVRATRFYGRLLPDGETRSLGVVEPGKGSGAERLALRYRFPRAGQWEVWAEVDLPQDGQTISGEGIVTLCSPPLHLRIADSLDAEQLAYAGEGRRNLLRGVEFEASASSQNAADAPGRAFDGRQGTHWACAGDDEAPFLRLRLRRPLRARRLSLSHAQPRRSHSSDPRVARLRVVINGSESFELDLDPDPMRKSSLDFGERLRIRELELEVLSLRGAELGRASVGLAEVELLDP